MADCKPIIQAAICCIGVCYILKCAQARNYADRRGESSSMTHSCYNMEATSPNTCMWLVHRQACVRRCQAVISASECCGVHKKRILFSAGHWTLEWWHCVPQCTAAGASSLSRGIAFTSCRTTRLSQPLRNYTPQHVFLSETFSSATIMFASLLRFLYVILYCHCSGHGWQTY